MKRRNAESGKMRRPIKRTKITEGMYGNSMLYLKFVMLWAAVVVADYMLEFRFEFLWPFWMMLRSVYDSFKYQGLAFSVFFICIALTSDMICFFFIPLQYIFFAASTYVWVQYVWYTFADKGVCLPTVAICCLVVYVEGALRSERSPAGGLELCRPLAAHCVGYPAVSLGFGLKSYAGRRLRLRRQRQVRAQNEFYFQLMKDALPESALQNQQPKETPPPVTANGDCVDARPSSARRRKEDDAQKVSGSLNMDEKPSRQTGGYHGCCGLSNSSSGTPSRLFSIWTQATVLCRSARPGQQASHHLVRMEQSATTIPMLLKSAEKPERQALRNGAAAHAHAHTNGSAAGAGAGAPPDDDHDHNKGCVKPLKCDKKEAISLKEEKRRSKNKDKDKDSDSHKSTEQTKEQIVKDVESTKDNNIVRNHKDCNSYKDKERERADKERDIRDRERERERELREKEKEREREREREREQREARECAEELKRVVAELASLRSSEAEAKRALAAAAAAERQRRADHAHLKQAHIALQHKVTSWRATERAALERRLGEERRARTAAETQRTTPECENTHCKARRSAHETEAGTLRRELRRAHERAEQLARELAHAHQQVRSLESRREDSGSPRLLANAYTELQERATHLERSLSAETRVKLDLLSALGDAKRHMHLQEGLITRQEKQLEELKAQMLAVMPTDYVTPVSGSVSKLRLSEGSPLDPNASVYTPKQLCSDA